MNVNEWVCVPREATEQMKNAWAHKAMERILDFEGKRPAKGIVHAAGENYKAMLAAAPSPAPVPVDPAEIEALRRDAARYRWLRDSSNDYANDIVPVILVSDEKTGDDMLAEEKLDAAIDAALAANGEKV